jgi:8-oxo-dGTP pyrophosphatase MutT (NUDIX family)
MSETDHLLRTTYLAGFAVVIASTTRRLLLLRSSLDNQLWKLPGGVIEPGEDAAAGVEREVLEETGCRLKIGTTLITRFERLSPQAELTAVLYAPTTAVGEFSPQLSAEHDMYRWISLEQLPEYEIDSPLEQHLVREFISVIAQLCGSRFGSTLERA